MATRMILPAFSSAEETLAHSGSVQSEWKESN